MSAKKARQDRQRERAENGGITAKDWARAQAEDALRLEQRLARKSFDQAHKAAQRIAPREARRMKSPTVNGLRLTVSRANRETKRQNGDD
jgi:hypothetical protein